MVKDQEFIKTKSQVENSESVNLIGEFEVKLNYENVLYHQMDRTIRVLLFSVESDEDRETFLKSTFTICGQNLCYWSKLNSGSIIIEKLAGLTKNF